jgi:porin
MRGSMFVKSSLLLVVLAILSAGHTARGQPVDVPSTWGGSLESRPRLTGSWDGVRDELGKKGIVLDVDLLLTPQWVVSGGRSTGGDMWGNGEYTLNVDTQKAGWWPGGFLRVQGITGFGSNVVHDSGAIIPVNADALLPGLNDNTTALTNLTFMQFLSEKFGVMLGKFNTFNLGEYEFYGDYHTQFLNTAFLFPMTLQQVPVAAWGAGVIGLPTKDITLSALVLNADGTPTTNPIFGGPPMVLASGQLTTHFWDMLGHQNVGFGWNGKERYSLEQDPSNIAKMLLFSQYPALANPGPELTAILKQYFPGLLVPTVPPNTESSSWEFEYSFDQYFWQPDKSKSHEGIGVFFAFGVSDGNPNPIKYGFLVGVGGKGVVPGRANDTFGLGFASTQFSSAFVPYLRERLPLGLEQENAFEAYYNMAVTGWLQLSADIQVVDPALKKTLVNTQLENVNTAVVLGLRLRVRF